MLNFPIDLSLAIAVIGCILAIIAFFNGQRKAAIMEGKHQEVVAQLAKRQVELEAKVLVLVTCYQNTDADIREIKTDIEWIRETLKEIKSGLAK
jgi:hypothetical protein